MLGALRNKMNSTRRGNDATEVTENGEHPIGEGTPLAETPTGCTHDRRWLPGYRDRAFEKA
jgi:hypothetical protein